MHLPVEVIRQPPIIIQATQIRATHIAHLQLLMPTGPTGIAQRLQLALLVGLGRQRLADAEELLVRARHLARLAQDLDLEQAGLDAAAQVGDLLQQGVRLADLVGRLLEPPLRHVDAPVALVDVLLQVAHVVILEPPLRLLRRRRRLVLRLQRLAVHLRARPQVLLRVGEEVVRAGPREEGAADLGVRYAQLGGAGGCAGAHKLF